MYYPNPAPKKKNNGLRILAVALVGAVVLCGIGAIAVAVSGQKPAAVATPTGPAADDTTGAPATSAAPAPAKTPAVPSIADGTWTVGEDFPAGTYKTIGAGADCYWSITKSGSNGADIIDNHIGGGNLRVTLKAGQDFETKRCGTWQKA